MRCKTFTARARALLEHAEQIVAPEQVQAAVRGAAEVIITVFADKDLGCSKPVQPDILGLTIPNRFVVGFGMDVYGYWRNLPGLWTISPDDLKRADG